MRQKHQLAIIIGIVLAIIVLTFGYRTVGRAIAFPTDEELMSKTKDLIDSSPAAAISDLDACIIVQIQDRKFSYDITRQGGVTAVEKSEYDCDGQSGEDIVMKFLHYSSFLKFTNDPSNCNLWINNGDGTDFYWLPSKAVNPGFTANCDTKLCPAITQCIPDEANLTQMGLGCCV